MTATDGSDISLGDFSLTHTALCRCMPTNPITAAHIAHILHAHSLSEQVVFPCIIVMVVSLCRFRWTAEKGFEAIVTMHHMTDLKTGMDLLDIFGQHAEKAVY